MKKLLLLLAALLIGGGSSNVSGKTLAIAAESGITISLTDTPCAMKAVSNLPYRATWSEKGKTFEGCFSIRPDVGVVVGYFEDGSVALIPIQAFKSATEA